MLTRLAAGIVALSLGLSGCGLLERDPPEEVPNVNPAGSSSNRALTLVDWGVVDGLLSVRLRNTTERTLERANALVTIRLADGVSLSSGPSVPDDECCTLLGVPPGGDFGVYVDIGLAAEPEAHYVLVSTREHGPQTGLVGDDVEFRSFRIVDGEVSEEEVEVVESYLFGHTPTTVVYD